MSVPKANKQTFGTHIVLPFPGVNKALARYYHGLKGTMKRRKRCARCGSTKCVTRHHIIPRRHGSNGQTMWLCRTPCHDEIERIIDERETASGVRIRLPNADYRLIARSFVAA